jgi:cytochrome P450
VNELRAETDRAQRPDDWDPVSPLATAEPLTVQAEMRARCPVAWTSRLGRGFWALFRYDDIVRAAIDTATFSVAGHPRLGERPSPPLEVDRPEHTMYRRLLQPYFTRDAVSRREAEVRALAQAMLEPVAAAGSADVAAAFTYPYPALVLCRLLRIPDGDWVRLKQWADEFFQAGQERDDDPVARAAANRKLLNYGAELVRDRRARNLDPEEDLLTRLVTAQIDGAPLSDERIAGIVRLLLTAGHNSTTSSLGNVFLRLAVDRKLQARLRAEPEQIEAAIEEILRFETPVMTTPRYLTRDVQVGGRHLRAGETVALVWASGNRDASHFTTPDQCSVDRGDNDHLVFGRGIHKCLGIFVALNEIRIAVEEMFAATEAFELDGEPVRTNWERFGVSRLPLRLTAAATRGTP